MSTGKILAQSKPYFAVIFLQFGYAGMAVIAKAALNNGMNHYTFAVYRNLTATVIFAPFAFFFERKIRPKMTFSVFWKIMLLGLLEPVIDQNLYYTGMKYTTATFTTALGNVLPAITFILAWILRLEQVNVRKLHSQAKILGTSVTIGGAMIMTLVRGGVIGLPWTKEASHDQSASAGNSQQDPVKGAAMIAAGCCCWASFYILQAITLKSYPAGLSLTSLLCGMGALQGSVLTLVVERGNAAIWAVHWDTTLLAYIYSGVICSGVAYYISGVVMKDKGPVFVTAFNPLSMIIVAIMGSFILAEQLDFGKVLGACVIVVGLYLVIWGSSKDDSSKSSGDDLDAPVDQQLPVIRPATTHQEQHSATPIEVPGEESV
ncbi:PREDICTED: WAT1-related protein At2g39510-like [Ipomoea nil]|uniref:WAT1-related protein At2g39510-like n=1 Tax=Ipomoea nil TaxID=35883 RepID=UPI000900ADD7|nr:PREDICTED: WAT1-related protein At2g39510-like [Ipomoea nil]